MSWDRSKIKGVRAKAMQKGYVSRACANEHDLNVDLNWHYTRVKEINETFCESMCVEVPYGHRFIQDGFAWGNSQGGGFPVAVYMIDDSMLVDRSLTYTAISRAKQMCVSIGSLALMQRQVGKVSVDSRKTFLKEMLTE
jgi:hypothetical protein